MTCSNCDSSTTTCIKTVKMSANITRRMRRCEECGHTFITHEVKTLEALTRPRKLRITYVAPEEFERMFLRD